MKKFNIVCYLLLIISMFLMGCSDKKSEDATIRLNVSVPNGKGFIATDDHGGKYDIPDSDFEIKNSDGNDSSWDMLKNAKVIEVHFSGGILETNPARFEKITKVVIIS